MKQCHGTNLYKAGLDEWSAFVKQQQGKEETSELAWY